MPYTHDNPRRVRATCGTTGIDIGYGLCLIVSAQDNDIFVDKILEPEEEGHPTLPVPNEYEISGARAAIRYLKYTAKNDSATVVDKAFPG